jgi:outer membrane protein
VERLRTIQPSGIEAMGQPHDPPTTGAELQEGAKRVRSRFDGLSTAEITLEECRASALERNLDLQVVLVDPVIAATAVSEEEAAWESILGATYRHNQTDDATSSELSSAQGTLDVFQPEVTIPTRTGGSVTVGLPIVRNENDNDFTTLNPAYTTDFQVGLSQQLLRGGGRRANTNALRIASYNRDSADEAQDQARGHPPARRVSTARTGSLYAARRALEVAQQQYRARPGPSFRPRRPQPSNVGRQVREIESRPRPRRGFRDPPRRRSSTSQNRRPSPTSATSSGSSTCRRAADQDSPPPSSSPPATQPDPGAATRSTARDDVDQSRHRSAAWSSSSSSSASPPDRSARSTLPTTQALPLLTLDYAYRVNGLGGTPNESTRRDLRDNNFEDWALGLTARGSASATRAATRRRSAAPILTPPPAPSPRARRAGARDHARRCSTRSTPSTPGWQRIHRRDASPSSSTTAPSPGRAALSSASAAATSTRRPRRRDDASPSAQLAELRARRPTYQIAQVDLAFATGTLLGASRIDWAPRRAPALKSSRATRPT